MKKIVKRIVIAIGSIGIGYLVLKFLLITFVLYFSNRTGDGELRPEETKLFNQLKVELHLKKISRTPEYNISVPKENETYGLYFRHIKCNVSKNSLDKTAKKIVLRVDKELILTHKFSFIEFTFYRDGDCPPYIIDYNFSRNDIEKLKRSKKM